MASINSALGSTYQSFSPFVLSSDEKEASASPAGSSDSPLSARAHSTPPPIPGVLDPRTAGKRIIRFLNKKARLSKALIEFRGACAEKHAISTPEKTTFTVKTVSIADYPKIKETIIEWKSNIEDLEKKGDLSDRDLDKLYDSLLILNCIESEMTTKLVPQFRKEYKKNFLLVATTPPGIIQALAFTSRAHRKRSFMNRALSEIVDYNLDYLSTAPRNLKLSFQKDCISGAPTSLIEEIVFQCLNHTRKKAITLTALPPAIPYYEKLGFQRTGPENLILTKDRFIKFLSTYGGASLPSH